MLLLLLPEEETGRRRKLTEDGTLDSETTDSLFRMSPSPSTFLWPPPKQPLTPP